MIESAFFRQHSFLHKHAADFTRTTTGGLLVELFFMQCRRLCIFADLFVCFLSAIAGLVMLPARVSLLEVLTTSKRE